LNSNAGSHFDPKVVRAFMTIPNDEWEEIRRSVQCEGFAETTVDKRAISSFIFSLGAPEKVSSKLRALCA
jgi:hypothetical protein